MPKPLIKVCRWLYDSNVLSSDGTVAVRLGRDALSPYDVSHTDPNAKFPYYDEVVTRMQIHVPDGHVAIFHPLCDAIREDWLAAGAHINFVVGVAGLVKGYCKEGDIVGHLMIVPINPDIGVEYE